VQQLFINENLLAVGVEQDFPTLSNIGIIGCIANII